MKIYYSNAAHFMGDGFKKLINFNIYNGTDLIEMVASNTSNALHASTASDIDYTLGLTYTFAENNDQKQTSSKFSTLLFASKLLDTKCYVNLADKKTYSLTLDSKKWKSIATVSCPLIKESTIRDFSTIDSFVYFTFPYKFINDNLSKTLGQTDLENTRIWYDLFKHDVTFENMIKAKDIVDGLHTKTIKHIGGASSTKPENIYKWRFDLSFAMAYSIKKYGYYNPVINSGNVMFFDGTHRLGFGSMVEKDVPYLQNIPHKHNIDDTFYTITPSFFRNNEHAIFLFDIKNKKIQVWFIKPSVLKKTFYMNAKSEIIKKDPILLDNIVTTYIGKSKPDCEILLNPLYNDTYPVIRETIIEPVSGLKKPKTSLI